MESSQVQASAQTVKKSLKDQMLEIPWIYNFVQFVFGAGELCDIMRTAISAYSGQRVLELGSGTGAFSPSGFSALTVTDVNQAYLDQIQVPCKKVLASATDLPFEDNSYDMVFAAGLYHHLSDEEFLKSTKEIRRVLRPEGVFLNIDNIPPTRAYRVLAGAIRKMDRGRFVRTISAQRSIMESQLAIDKVESGTYSWCGLEYVLHVCKKVK